MGGFGVAVRTRLCGVLASGLMFALQPSLSNSTSAMPPVNQLSPGNSHRICYFAALKVGASRLLSAIGSEIAPTSYSLQPYITRNQT